MYHMSAGSTMMKSKQYFEITGDRAMRKNNMVTGSL